MADQNPAQRERQSWRFVMDVQFVPPGLTVEIDSRTVVGPKLIESSPRWERIEETP